MHYIKAIFVGLLITANVTAQQAEERASLTINASVVAEESYSGVGRGFLHGLNADASEPGDDLLLPLKPRSFRAGGKYEGNTFWNYPEGNIKWVGMHDVVKAHIQRTTKAPYNAIYELVMSDVYGYGAPSPCDNGDCNDWIQFINALLDKMDADGLINDMVRFDIWNEPDIKDFWTKGTEQYHAMWNAAVNTIRARFPHALIVGPSTSGYKHNDLQDRLNRFKADGTVPDIWSWHFSVDPVADADDARTMLKEAGYPDMKLDMNEYLLEGEQKAGTLAWYLARLQRSKIDWASHAIWANCCHAGLLDNTLVLSDGQRITTGEYWVYQSSASLTGKALYSEGASGVDLIATRDDDTHHLTVLLGSKNFKGTLTVKIDGLDKMPFSVSGKKVKAVIKRIADGIIAGPTLESEKVLPVKNGSVEIVIPWIETSDAYFIDVEKYK
jgi:hypothetical protein